ncbi:hypothetical protein KP509_10G084100 [Ceratopteris richardii]|uniref:mitogen-activated protein kinase kinase n=1 Tax=Ceratopteris richardii TaxID=49495 RepID=A0A8T2U179_CERRI|nr:hypothetical protein KP509_10G084100 [Ceratopteris richardii]
MGMRSKYELQASSVPGNRKADESRDQRRHNKPAPLPLPAPSPRPSGGVLDGSGRPKSRALAMLTNDVTVSSSSEGLKIPASCAPTESQFVASGFSSNLEEINPNDTVKISILGRGSSGVVYKVQHKKNNKLYALKVIQDKHEPEVCKRILTEMSIHRRAHNPYVVQCFGAFEKGGEISLVLEYMDGGSLQDVIKAKKTISERYLADIAMKALKGLDYLHRNKIVHRDIKPSNILLGRNQEVKIADFGVSTILANSLAACNTFVGTCAYMSPERFDPDQNDGRYNGYAADIWSLGMSLLECTMGHFPLVAPGETFDWATVMFAICYNSLPSPPEDSSPEFKDFVAQCLQKDPSLRPRASTLLSHPFVTKFQAVPSSIKEGSRSYSRSGGQVWRNFNNALNSIFS